MKLTENFSKAEFDCHDGSEMPSDVLENVKELAKNMQVLRDELGVSIHLTNGYRSPSHNKKVGGAKNSMHLYGKACDMKVKGMTPKQVLLVIERLIKEGKMMQGGIGLYNTFTHYDIRGTKARWNG
jgi:uncharacterized protein YcbK (DUF882 family)